MIVGCDYSNLLKSINIQLWILRAVFNYAQTKSLAIFKSYWSFLYAVFCSTDLISDSFFDLAI